MSGKSIDYPYPNLYSRKFVTPCMWQVSWLAFLLKNLPIRRSRQWHCSVSTSLKKKSDGIQLRVQLRLLLLST